MSDDPVIWEWTVLRERWRGPTDYERDRSDEVEVRALSITLNRLGEGKPVERAELPANFFLSEQYMKVPKSGLPDVFWSASILTVSERLKDLLETFDIGETRFHGMPILGLDRKTPVPGRWFVFNFVSEKPGFDALATFGRPIEPNRTGRYNPLRSSHLPALRESAARGADLWADPLMDRTLFVSDRLKQAMERAAIRSPETNFRRCRIVKLH